MTKLRYSMFVVTVMLALALSALMTIPALADDSAPPPTETPTVETPPIEEVAPVVEAAAPTDVPVVEEAVPEETTVTDEAASEETAPVEETAPQEETTAELLASVPEGTELVVVNAEGETVPLVTQEAAEIIASSDPQWCPVGVAPNSATCSGAKDSFNGASTLTDLIAWLVANQPDVAGVIWIEPSYTGTVGVEGGPILLNGASFAGPNGGMDNFALTINGGWTGTGTTLNPNTPSIFNVSLSIISWNGIITLNNLLFTGVTTGSASNNAALNIDTTKNVILNNVNTSNNTGVNVKGVHIDNDEGTSISSVTVNASNLNGNNATGLTVFSDGIITLKDVTASNNNGVLANGIYLDNTAGSAVGITFTGATIASDNGGDGIKAYSNGAITASNLVANSNDGNGATLFNLGAGTPLGITISGSSNQFKFNGNAGLDVESTGAITLNSISANNNGLFGAYVGAGLNVTLTGTNSFNENLDYGLAVSSHNGSVTLSNVTANFNGSGVINGFGLSVDNSNASTPKAVTLTGINQFNGNYSNGLYIASIGAITISNLTASDNVNGRGASLNNVGAPSPQNVTVTGTTIVNTNGLEGLFVTTLGAISIGSITANENGESGVSLNNNLGTTPKPVTLSGTSNNFNGNTGGSGLYILSLGAVTLNNVSASNNTSGRGLYVDNSGGTGGITLNGTSGFFSNGDSGIEMYSTGNILIKDLDSNGNGTSQIAGTGYGAYLYNAYLGSIGNVTVGTTKPNWFNGFSDNFSSGLEIYSNGMVTLTNITADGNGLDNGSDPEYGYGLYVDNRTATTAKVVTLNGENQFNDNFSGGVYLLSDGAITVNKVTANDNFDGGGLGAFFVNNTASPLSPQNVTLNGYGDFFGNGNRGLEVQSLGVVTLNSIYADTNANDGVFVDNYTSGTMAKAVTINGYANTYNNGGVGLYILSRGAIKVNNLDASANGSGASLDNHETGAVGGVTVTGHAWASDNTSGDGLYVESFGAINITNLSTWGNAGRGATLDNGWSGAVSPVTILGYASAGFNGSNGITVLSNRAITITNLYADTNGGDGAYIDNSYSGTALPQNVTINGYGQFYNNGDTGLWIYTYGIITTTNLTANGNGTNLDNTTPTGWGVILDNSDADPSKPRGVTLNGTNTFNGNFQDGLLVLSLGVIKANNLTAIINGGSGAILNNQFDIGNFGVTLTGINLFESNDVDGLNIFSNGAVTASNVSANWNFGNGAYIDTYNPVSAVARVTLTGNNTFNGNGDGVTGGGQNGTGLIVFSDTVVTINNLTAKWNTEEGAALFSSNGGFWFPFPVTIKLTGINTFSGNGSDGLYFEAPGNVDITKITADGNGGNGVEGYSDGNITITCGSMTNNTGFGWNLTASTVGKIITLKGVFATGNTAGPSLINGTLVTVRTCPLP